MANVPSRAERGQQLQAWLKANKVSKSRIARHAGITRESVYAAIRGEAKEGTYERLEAARAHIEQYPDDEPDEPRAVVSTKEGIIEVELTDVYGVGRIAVRGPVGNTDEMEAFVRRVIDYLQKGQRSD